MSFVLPSLISMALIVGPVQKESDLKVGVDERFAVYVHDVEGDLEENKSLVKTTEEIKKRFAGKKSKFRLVDDSLDAAILVEVLREGRGGDFQNDVNRQKALKDAAVPEQSSDGGRPEVLANSVPGYTIEYRYSIPGKFEKTMIVTGPTLRDAAKDLPRMLFHICDVYCR